MAAGTGYAGSRTDVVEGNPRSPLRVVIYEDLQCSECATFRTLLDEKILPRYGSRVAFVHRDFPLGRHDWARSAAIAGRWVYAQDPAAGITFRREIMAEQNSLTSATLQPWLQEFAGRYKLDPRGIVNALSDVRLATLVDQDLAAGSARGVSTLPAVFVGNQVFSGTVLEDDLAPALDEALK